MKSKNFPARLPLRDAKRSAAAQQEADWPAVGFVDFAGGNYRLSDASKYKAAGTDGKPLGADIDAIEAAIKKTR